LATGLFATKTVNEAGGDGLFYGNPGQLVVQLLAVLAVVAYSIVMTWVILKVIDALIGLRVGEAEERLGLDASQHGELAYQL
jgi:Amt family ammonium transporter